MKRRDFLMGSAGLAAGSILPPAAGAQTKPCMPPSLQVVGGTSVTTTCPAQDGAADWIARSTAPGVLWATDFDADAKVNNYRFSSGVGLDTNPAPGSVGSYVRRNPTDGILGRGCLELEQLTNGNLNSYWWRPFNPACAQYQMYNAGSDFSAGQEFYLQVRLKVSAARLGIAGAGGGGNKLFSVSRTENSYTAQEIVAQDTYYRRVFQMYQGVGAKTAYQPIEEPVAPYDFNLQPGSEFAKAPGYCSYSKVSAGDRSGCWLLGPDEWITYLMRVVPSRPATNDGSLQVWAWKAGMTGYVKIVDKQNFWMTYDAQQLSNGTIPPPAFNAVLLWGYETGRTSGPAGQKQFYDQVILSRSQIACPSI